MIRLHKRNLKSARLIKKININKKKNKEKKSKISGTGSRFMSFHNYQNHRQYLENPYRYNGCHRKIDRWSLNHPNQIMESKLHDRTKWKSSKLVSKQQRNYIKLY